MKKLSCRFKISGYVVNRVLNSHHIYDHPGITAVSYKTINSFYTSLNGTKTILHVANIVYNNIIVLCQQISIPLPWKVFQRELPTSPEIPS